MINQHSALYLSVARCCFLCIADAGVKGASVSAFDVIDNADSPTQ